MAVELNEHNAIAQLKRGEIRGLDALMLIYQVRAVRAAYVVTHDVALAEDIVQSAFIRAYERIEQFDDTRPFGPWFLRSVVNSAASAAGQRRRFVPFAPTRDTDAAVADADANAVVGPEPDPETLILQAETNAELWRALDQLPPSQRATAVLRLYLEVPEAEAAVRLGVPIGTVKSRLNAARTRLRLVLGRPSTDDGAARMMSTSAATTSSAEACQLGQEARR
jgi:RNA polymerase sigma-70 factor (ECF subfamily)